MIATILLVLLPFTLIGLLVMVQLFKSVKGVDDSNIFNRLRIFWFALTRMDQMVEKFPWLKKDEWENMK